MDHDSRVLGLAVLTVALLPSLAAAQAPPQTEVPVAPKVEQLDPNACARANRDATVGKGSDVEEATPDGRNRSNLSDKLARSNGVICPPTHVDPEIEAPTPPGGPMPVIPPPGSPGGDQNVRPK